MVQPSLTLRSRLDGFRAGYYSSSVPLATQRAAYYFRVARKIVHAVEAWHPDPLGITNEKGSGSVGVCRDASLSSALHVGRRTEIGLDASHNIRILSERTGAEHGTDPGSGTAQGRAQNPWAVIASLLLGNLRKQGVVGG